jgi:hypothetical protein
VTDVRLLGIYLNDHLGGSTVATQRCRASRDANRGNDVGAFLDGLLREIEQDRQTLLQVMASLGVRPSPLKTTLGWVVERVGRLKLNGRLTGYSPLSRLLELELLSLGVEGKRALWIVLGDLDDQRLAGFDFAALAGRAQGQRDGLERHRREAARSAFA